MSCTLLHGPLIIDSKFSLVQGLMSFLVTCSVHPLTTGSTEVTSDEDKKNSTLPSYVNVESNDGSISMTTNPSYGQVDRKHGCPKPVYGNL